MADSSGVTPPSSGSSSSSSSSSDDLMPKQVQTGMSKAYEVKGNSAIRAWAKHFYPQMSGKQLEQFVQQFLMTICQQISQQIGKEMQQARKAAQKMKRAQEGGE